MAGIQVRSPSFSDHDFLARHHSREGENLPPGLEWSGVPEGTAELVVTCEDPDAPRGTFTHWLLAGITPGTSGFGEGEVPDEAVAGRNDFGEPGYGGPLPPAGDRVHRYFFHVLALGRPSGLSEGFDRVAFERALSRSGQLASGTIVGLYQR